MGRLSVQTGKAHERAVAETLRKWFPGLLVKRGAQSAGAQEPDLVLSRPGEDGGVETSGGRAIPDALFTLWWELECGKHPAPAAKLAQARRDLGNRKLLHDRWHFCDPVIVWRKKGSALMYCTLEVGTLARLVGCVVPGAGDSRWLPVQLAFADLLDIIKTGDRDHE